MLTMTRVLPAFMAPSTFGTDHDDVAAQNEVSPTGRDADRMNVVRSIGNANVAGHCTTLLRQPGHINNADAFSFKVRGHADDRTNRDDPRASDAGDNYAVGMIKQRSVGRGQSRPVARLRDAFAPLQLCTMHGDKRGAETFQTGVVLVAARLINGPLAAPFSLQRLHRYAIRLHAAVAAALADQIVDDDPLVRVGERTALAATAFFGSASLIVDEDAHAGYGRKLTLNGVKLIAMMHGQSARPIGVFRVFPRLICDHDHTLCALGGHLRGDLRHSQTAIVCLPTGHGDGIVKEDFVGHRHAGSDRGADREIARVVVGAVTEILEHVLALGKGASPIQLAPSPPICV